MAFGAHQKHLFYLELAKLIEAGFGIKDAARTMLDQDPPRDQVALLESAKQKLDAGEDVATALGHDTGTITALERKVIEAGELGGRMGEAFQHLADYFGMLSRYRKQALTAMIYPAILLHLGVFVGIVPATLMQNLGNTDGIWMRLLIAFAVVYVVGFAMVMVVRLLLSQAPKNESIDRFLNAIPLFGKLRKNMAMARFTKVYHICLVAGVPMRETANSAATASHSALISEAGDHLVQTVSSGDRLGPAFLSRSIFPKAFARSYATAEESGSLDKDLARWAGVFQRDTEEGAKNLSVAIPKILYFGILIFVAFQIIRAYTGYLQGITDMLPSSRR